MSLRLTLFVLALTVAACSQGAPPQSSGPDPAQQPAPQAPASPPQQAAAPAPADTATSPPAAPAPADRANGTPRTPRGSATPATTDAAATAPGAPASTPASASATGTAAAEPEPPEPQFREVTIPAGTALDVRLTTPIASDTSQLEDEVRGTLTKAIVRGGVTAIPAGAEVVGTVRAAKRSGRVKGRASIAFRFERVVVRDEPLPVRTATVSREAAPDRSDDVKKGAIGGAAGAIVGGIVGGGKGAAIGAGVGGAGAVVATRGDEVRLEPGTVVRTTLQQPLKIVVPLKEGSD